jgi:glutaminyl-peptide cyclotransferase
MKKIFCFILVCFSISLMISSCGGNDNNSNNNTTTDKPIPTLDFESLKSYPHDTNAFTEGFLIHDGKLFESTGATKELAQTKSLFGIVDLTTGKIETKVELDRAKYFGEGITFLNGKVYQLTYQTKIGFIYDATTFKKIKEFTFSNKEGWGMTTDGTNLIMSDGTNILTYLDPDSLKVVKTLFVTENGFVKNYLNELEYIKGYIYANIWTTNTIVKINPADGVIVGKLDLSSLASEAKSLNPGSLEMNGIAYDSINDKILVTGKLWPKIFEIKIQ